MGILFIAAGGALGAVLRYGLSGWVHKAFSGMFPLGTLVVNLAGSLVIGLLWGFSEHVVLPHNVRVMLFVGVLGAFTTFSTFSLENFHLIRDGEYLMAGLNMALSFVLGIALVFAGYFAARMMTGALR